jgi:HD-GYP domain-containing protein (c-di-GMP phosphodiesterase class II)
VRSRGRLRGLVAGVLVSLLVAAFYLYRPTGLADLDQRTYDLLLRWTHRSATSGRVVVVDVDERSLAQFGRWPWPRSRIARLLRAIQGQGAASVGVDMMFPEPDETPGVAVDARAARALAGLPTLSAQDAVLATVLGEGPFVIGYEFTFDAETPARSRCVLHPVAFTTVEAGAGGPAGPGLFRAATAICSLEGIAAAAGGAGFLNAAPDGDGILRRIPLLIEYDGRAYASLALATVMKAVGGRQLILATSGTGSAWLRLGEAVIPVDARGNLLLHFRGRRGRIAHVSAADVVAERLPADALRDRIVFVGTSALGLRDTVATPLDPVFPGVEVHATVADNILAGDFVSRPGPARAIELGLVLAAGPVVGILLAGTWWAAVLVVGLGAGLWWAAAWALGSVGAFVSPLFPTIALGASASSLAFVGFVTERRRAERGAESLAMARQLVLHVMTSLTEIRDPETGAHLLRTQHYARVLGRALARHPRFRDVLTRDTIELLASLAPIHDIGKVGVPDRLLRKPGPFTAEEWEEMRKHPAYGLDVIERAQRRVGIGDELLIRLAKEIVYSHHERWDGAGYPRGLKGDAIPVAGRLVALVDVYDALVSERVYKRRLPHDEVADYIVAGRGTQFDPDVVDAFVNVQDEWRRISIEFADHPEALGATRQTSTPAS